MNAIKRGVATLINSFTSALTLFILPIILLFLNKPLVGQSLFDTQRFSTRSGNFMYGVIFAIMCATVIGFILIIIWCIMGKEPLAFTATKALGFN